MTFGPFSSSNAGCSSSPFGGMGGLPCSGGMFGPGMMPGGIGGGHPSGQSSASGQVSPYAGGTQGNSSPQRQLHPTGDSPTINQFAEASRGADGIPTNLRPLTQDGQQVSETLPSGMVGKAYVTPDNKVIVGFGGTGSGGGAVLPGQLQADAVGGSGGVSQAQSDAADFTRRVQGIADQQGLGAGNVYVTGHSLGGMEAQYAAAQTGAGGMSFEAPGSTPGSNPVGDGSNFVNVRDQSDPIANIGNYYGRSVPVNTGLGLAGHMMPVVQINQLPANESLSALLGDTSG